MDLGCDERILKCWIRDPEKIWILRKIGQVKDGIEELKNFWKKFKEGLTGRMEEVFLPGGQAWREDGTIQVEEFYMGEVGNCVRRLLGRRICILITWNRYKNDVLEDMDLK